MEERGGLAFAVAFDGVGGAFASGALASLPVGALIAADSAIVVIVIEEGIVPALTIARPLRPTAIQNANAVGTLLPGSTDIPTRTAIILVVLEVVVVDTLVGGAAIRLVRLARLACSAVAARSGALAFVSAGAAV